MWWLQAAIAVASTPTVWGQTDAFEFSWPGNTDQCGVSLISTLPYRLIADDADLRSDMEWRVATIQSFLCVSARPTSDCNR